MKRFLILLSFFLILFSCSFEEDHEVKEVVREYLNETLHDPDSMEEINWRITKFMRFKPEDSLNENSPLIVDWEATSDTAVTPELYLVRLKYRARNGFGAMRANEIFATYDKEGNYMQFEDIGYSYELESFINVDPPLLMEPRRLFLRNEYILRNRGEVTMEDFWREYPEYD